MVFLNQKKRAEIMIREKSAGFADRNSILFGPKYKEFVAKSITLKNKSKELFGAMKQQRKFTPKGNGKKQSFLKNLFS